MHGSNFTLPERKDMSDTMRRRHFLAGAAAAAMTSGFSSRRAYSAIQPQVLRMGFINPRDSQFGAGALEFATYVERNCGGRLRVELYPAGETGGELEMCQDVASGTLEMTFTSSAVFTAIAPELSVFDIPFLFRDLAHARGVMDGEIGKALDGPFWHPVSWLRRADRSSISSFHLADLGGKAVDTKLLSLRSDV